MVKKKMLQMFLTGKIKIMKITKPTKGKIKIYEPFKYSRSKNKDKGFASYTCYYKGHSIDVYGKYSPKAAVRSVLKLIKKGEL